ncbi:TIGR04053 family radical SAM/SPASM domain-containing protein [Aeropyrum camini]|uniref:PqqE-like protein n=1 Tax=Aeropyrum camini SY1 = JCM 12091 TaxID=1198449 RepID=U3TDJ5_9CREN|nr:TIGR04053 family radical SAM/SPASM domain-containing protein [Aeropyrum camini]BAN90506.1 PqqE-like protein [Aeropyrum camini SY1 = JCM 12091]
MRGRWPYEEKPLIVFWESTKACLLACKHCRAEALVEPQPGELSTREAFDLIDQVAEFGKPYPILVITGGDPLMRSDFWDILEYAVSQGLRVAVAPSVTPLLTREVVRKMARVGVARISISIDSGLPEVHDAIRGVPGTFKASVRIVREALSTGLPVQINTTVMRPTVDSLPETLKLLLDLGVDVWEVFYVVPTGRAARMLDLTPQEWEDVGNYLYDASRYGVLVRTVEGPMFRRIALTRRVLESVGGDWRIHLRPGSLYRKLTLKTVELLGEPQGGARAQTTGTRDGKGVIFVSNRGVVYPSGFLPYPVGDVRRSRLKEIYRSSPELDRLRGAVFEGRCGYCEFSQLCGGSRARAYSYTGNPLAEDPACAYKPGEFSRLLHELGVGEASVYELVEKLGHGRIL